jgi:hypothetical protein
MQSYAHSVSALFFALYPHQKDQQPAPKFPSSSTFCLSHTKSATVAKNSAQNAEPYYYYEARSAGRGEPPVQHPEMMQSSQLQRTA